MKKTNFTTLVSSGLAFGTKEMWKRVYVDKDGKRYIRENKSYKCIEGTKCIQYLTKD